MVAKRKLSSMALSLAVWGASVCMCERAGADLIVPGFSSDPGAAYTIYLDFGGFTYTGQWNTKTPGTTEAFEDATGSFTTAQLADIEGLWSRVAATYAPFNVNVTTVDPAVAAGEAATDLERQNYYDSTAQMMHTVIGGSGSWSSGGAEIGVSYVGVTAGSYPNSGLHTNWIFSDRVASPADIGVTTEHENGHGFGLQHQISPGGNSASGSIGTIMTATINLSATPVRSLFALGQAEGVGVQNDDEVIVSNANMGGFFNDGVGHMLATATPLPMTGNTVNFNAARGVIVPASSSSPVAAGTANYQSDFWSFSTTGGAISLTANSGEEFITPGTADPGGTLEALLKIFNSGGTVIDTSPLTSLSETISTTLAAGNYYAQVTSGGDASGQDGTTFFDQGPYFLSGTIAIPEPGAVVMVLSGAGVLLLLRRRFAALGREARL